MAAVTATHATDLFQSPTKKPLHSGFFVGGLFCKSSGHGAFYLRGRLGRFNQLATMNKQKTTNMMRRMCLISMMSPW